MPKLKALLKSDLYKNTALLIGASGISQLIPFLVLPFLQRYFYSPENFGLLSIYVSLSMMLVKISTLSYDFAIVKQENEKDALTLFKGSSISVVLISGIILIVVLALFLFFPSNFYVKKLNYFILVVPLSVLLFGFYQVLRQWMNWQKKYGKIGKSLLYKSGVAESSKVLFGFLKWSQYGLIAGRVLGELCIFIYMLLQMKRTQLSIIGKISRKDTFHHLKLNYKFPLYTMPSGMNGMLLNLILFSLMAKYFGLDKAGIIGIAITYIGAAYGIVSQSFSQVFYKKINDLENHQIWASLKTNVGILAMMSFLALLIVQLIPENWILTILGEKWIGFTPVLKAIMISLSLGFIYASVQFVFVRLNRQKEILMLDFINLIMVIGSIVGGYIYTNDFMQTLYLYVAAQSLFYVTALMMAFVFARKSTH